MYIQQYFSEVRCKLCTDCRLYLRLVVSAVLMYNFFGMYTECPPTFVYCANFDDPCKPGHKYVRCTNGSQIANCYKLENYCQLKPKIEECGHNATELCGKRFFVVCCLMHICTHLHEAYTSIIVLHKR